ncbi:replication-relaxation family protein [Dactylosporangium sp. NPDC006015]|uniref:replication-relaxation family protein n=1 Tax=Dactylosporangium sp. NPDC006015 TaxID=3154576 RepID=UPI0033A1D56E
MLLAAVDHGWGFATHEGTQLEAMTGQEEPHTRGTAVALEAWMTQPHHDPVLYAQSFLTDRDHRLLDWLYDHQVLSTAQITAALFNRQDAAQERLLRLYRLRLLERQCAARCGSAR